MLSPYRVLDLTDERGITCGQMLADLGAEVIAVEPPEGSRARRLAPFAGDIAGPERSLWWWAYSRGKKIVVADIRTAEGRQTLLQLAATADVIVESEDPGVMKSLGLGYEDLAAVNPALVYVSVSAFGQDGPKANWAATEINLWASCGVMPTIGDPERYPLRMSVPQSWSHGGALAAIGAVVALHERNDSGRGQHVDASAQQAATLTTMSMILGAAWNSVPMGRMPMFARVKTLFETKDGGYAVLGNVYGAQAAARSSTLMNLVYNAGFCDEATRDINWATFLLDVNTGAVSPDAIDKVNVALEAYAGSLTKDELFDVALANSLWIAPVRTMEDVARNAQLESRGYWQQVKAPGIGEYQAAGPFIRNGTETPPAVTVPSIGEHTKEVLASPRALPALPAPGTPKKRLPLEGVKILDFTWVMAAPHALRILADWGATVIHIESTKRVDLARTSLLFKTGVVEIDNSGWWQNLAAGKLSVTLDLSTEAGRQVVRDLAGWADMVTESYAPGQMAKWGLSYETIHEINPRAVMMSSTLFGQTGPHRGYAALGTQASPLMGFWDVTGYEGGLPLQPTGAYTDLVAPWYTAALLLAALDEQRRTGEGKYIDLAQGEAAFQFLAPALLDYTVNGHLWTRMGNDDLMMAPHGAYQTEGESGWVTIACRDDADWQRLARAMGRDDLAADPRYATAAARLERRVELDELVGAWTAGKVDRDIERDLQAAGVPAHIVATSKDCLEDPQLVGRGHFVTVDHPNLGPSLIEGSRFGLSRTEADVTRHGPLIGEHNEYVLREILGYEDDRIIELVTGGVLT